MEVFDRHGLMVGTPFTFQGEERDLMYLSLAVDDNSHSARFRHLSRPDAFNVSITRARLEQHVYTSLHATPSNPDALLHAYLNELEERNEKTVDRKNDSSETSDAFLREVLRELGERGIETWPAFRMAGLTMDIVLMANGRNIGVDLIGSPGQFGQPLPIDRYRMFHRAGLQIVPIPYSRWLLRRKECLGFLDHVVGRETEPLRSIAFERENDRIDVMQ